MQDIKKVVFEHIESKADLFKSIGKDIWNNPELGLKESFAHDLLCNILQNEGFSVERNFILETGFRAVYETSSRPHIAFLCEYDALPKLGHACGHNLIAEASMAAAIGFKAAMESHGIRCKLTVLGTPAEENEGGKLNMIDMDVFEDVDAALMVHPREINCLHMPHDALKDFTIVFEGKSAHATSSPWEGRNALDAAILMYQGISCFRKQMKPSWTVNANLQVDAECHLGIIPDMVKFELDIRAPTMNDLAELEHRIRQIADGASLMADCKVDVTEFEGTYENLESNKTILKLYKANATKFGLHFDIAGKSGGSTDMGNVSHLVPSIHPVYFIGSVKGPHTEEFAKHTGTDKAHKMTVIQGKILAATAFDLVTDQSTLQDAKREFEKRKIMNFPEQRYHDLLIEMNGHL